MFLHFELIFLLLANVLGLEVIWNNAADFDEATIRGVNNGLIKTIELPTFQVIFPGTLWCGAGNIAKDKDDLGFFKNTDKCCRSHDMCDDIIESGKTRYNLTNTASYTRLNCKCDLAFYNCLMATNSITSLKVAFLYFNMLETQCYQLEYPKTGCKKQAYIPIYRCLEYKFNTTGEKIYQWFDVPLL